MPSTRTGRQYSTRPSMPSSPTFRQGSHVTSPSSMMSNSVLRGLPPYRQQEQIPNITLPEYGTIIKDDDNYEDLMAILFPQSDLYSRTITMWHSSITQKLRREAERQEVKRIFIEMEGLGLQQVLHPYRNAPPSRILFTSSTTTHSILSCTKPGNKIPYPPTDVTTTRDTREPDPHWRWWWRTRWMKRRLLHCGVDLLYASLLPLTLSRIHWSTTSILQMSTIHMRSLLSTSSGTLSIWLSGRTLKPVTSTIVGDFVMNSFLLWHMPTMLFHSLFHIWSTCIHHKATMPFYICLPRFTLCFTGVCLKANTLLLPI